VDLDAFFVEVCRQVQLIPDRLLVVGVSGSAGVVQSACTGR
jgi:hypothetical protein